MGANRDEALVERALVMALERRKLGKGLLHHTDRGSQYTSRGYRGLLEQYGIETSMSRKGDCWDNALIESFFGTLKVECTDRYNFKTMTEVRTVIFEYMEVFYNRQRLHSALGFMTPTEFELLPV
ncbi:IS3 family transposase [Candidatus Chlorohelix allophototropha]|uniref:IS3 family transposase n=2 Tax=Candidatus Chlorohelix allophototropha TaxID=3003348 RepID=A0ABY9B8G0_9CHLR|nr:IS3 family transposase [Chloroflexota bacterium L227-S17]